jgi:hypothetical protein
MEVGSAQSQSLLAAVTTTTQFKAAKLTSQSGDTTSVLLSISKQVDTVYAQRVLDDSLADKFNAAFQEAGMDTNVESLLGSGLDFSPEATANRIVSFAVGFFGSFKANHQEDGPPDQIDGFTEMIKGAVEQGFAEARDMLEGIGDIKSETASNIDATFSLVMSGIDEFAQEQHSGLAEPQSPDEQPEEDNLLVT